MKRRRHKLRGAVAAMLGFDFTFDSLFYLALGLGSFLARALNRLIRGRKMGEYLGEASVSLSEQRIRKNFKDALARALYGLTIILTGDFRRDGFLLLAGLLSIVDTIFYLRGREYRKETVSVYEKGIRLQGKYRSWRELKVNRATPEALEFTLGSVDYHCSMPEEVPVTRIDWI